MDKIRNKLVHNQSLYMLHDKYLTVFLQEQSGFYQWLFYTWMYFVDSLPPSQDEYSRQKCQSSGGHREPGEGHGAAVSDRGGGQASGGGQAHSGDAEECRHQGQYRSRSIHIPVHKY